MVKSKTKLINIAVVLIFILLIAAACIISYRQGEHIGEIKGYADGVESIGKHNAQNTVTFYATVDKVNLSDKIVYVTGLPENEPYYQGVFRLYIEEDTRMVFATEDISIRDLEAGTTVSVTFADESILEMIPTPLYDVLSVIVREKE